MKQNEFSTETFEKDCLAVFEKLLQGYKRATQTSTWESDINALVDKLTLLPTAPFPIELMKLFDYEYLVLSTPIDEIIQKSLLLQKQLKHTQRKVTINEQYYSIPFMPKHTYLKQFEVFNDEDELCYEKVGRISVDFRLFCKWLLPLGRSVEFQETIIYKQQIKQYRELEIYHYSPFIDVDSSSPEDYYNFFCDYYGKVQFLNYFRTKALDEPELITGQFQTAVRIEKVLGLSSTQQVLWAYFIFRLMGLKLRHNLEVSTITKFLLLMNRTDLSDYRNSYLYKQFKKAPHILNGKNLLIELEKTRLLFKEGNLPTNDIEEVIAELLKK